MKCKMVMNDELVRVNETVLAYIKFLSHHQLGKIK